MKNLLIDPLKNLPSYSGLIEDINKDLSPLAVHGIIDENLGHISYGIFEDTSKPILLVTYDARKAKRLYEDIGSFTDNVYFFESKDPLFFKIDSYSLDIESERIKILSKLARGENPIVVTYVDGVMDKLESLDSFKKNMISLNFESQVNIEDFGLRLVELGYKREDMVEEKGQFSIRGGIIDIFAADRDNPYRIELFDTEIDSIRLFDVDSQRSLESLDKISLPQAREIVINDSYRPKLLENLERELRTSLTNLKLGVIRERVEDKFGLLLEESKEAYSSTSMDLIKPFIPKEELESILDYFPDRALIILDEPKRIEDEYEKKKSVFEFQYKDLLQSGEVLESHLNIYHSFLELKKKISRHLILTKTALIKTVAYFKPKAIYNFSSKSIQFFNKKLDILKEELDHYMYRGFKVIILVSTKERGRRLEKDFLDLGIVASFVENRDRSIKSGQILISLGNLEKGFEYSDIKFVLITERQIFGVSRAKKSRVKKSEGLSFQDLSISDYVVHENHGIGQYLGVENLTVQGVSKDYLAISYRGNDKLYVPIDQMNLVQKYIGSEGVKPKVNKLSTKDWANTKTRVKKAVEDMAKELLELYAKRESLEGYGFSKDSLWQKEFEDSFPYEETASQKRSIEEIKKDMEKPKPMDRLLCGDVGYGKTEVALRACFKAVMDNKQVAFLVPTTILAQQHYNTMVERFKDYPINIGVLSRFVSTKEQKETLKKLREGNIDILIGTHRILSKDIGFKDLGLLVVDEEQRFGVKHKEKLKSLKTNVDVLTLTATPIPRTLHMSLVGIRDMSVLDDPPGARYPIQTYVVEFNEQMIREAILKEIYRSGQVYFVYNRVRDIDELALRLQKLIPEAAIQVAHGQMGEKSLEKIMLGFISNEFDVLVSTTIIETGLDIPNVNTMIIYDADKMGLSQLYQLRGRVGRSNRVAYSYFTYERDKVLTEIAEKRLSAIKEFTEFGSGFKIAMRDLQIRGAGNLLGTEQHGHMNEIGYDLYVKFLNEAVKRLKGQEVKKVINTTIEVDVNGFIPDYYIRDEEQKIEVYKKIGSIESRKDYMDLLDELIDRFGDLPKQVENLLEISYVKSKSEDIGILNIVQRQDLLILEFDRSFEVKPELIHDLSKKYSRRLNFDLSKEFAFRYKVRKDTLIELKELVETIYSYEESYKSKA